MLLISLIYEARVRMLLLKSSHAVRFFQTEAQHRQTGRQRTKPAKNSSLEKNLACWLRREFW